MDELYNRVARRRRPAESGFTLIELLVVIAVLAILAAIILFNVVGVTNSGKTSACKTDQSTIQTAVDTYYNNLAQTGTAKYPDSAGDTATPTAGDSVSYTELVATNVIHTAPTTQFTYTGASGTINNPC